jgi:hypothetical protein
VAARVLLVLAALAVLYGCGQASSPVERQEKKVDVEQAEAEPPSEPGPSKDCADFYGPQDAGIYFDDEATASEKKVLDSDGDGVACEEPSAPHKQSEVTHSPEYMAEMERQEWLAEQDCRMRRYAELENLTQEEADRKLDEITDYVMQHEGVDMEEALDAVGVPYYPVCKDLEVGDE